MIRGSDRGQDRAESARDLEDHQEPDLVPTVAQGRPCEAQHVGDGAQPRQQGHHQVEQFVRDDALVQFLDDHADDPALQNPRHDR